MIKKDFYQILGVARSATEDEIKKSFRKLAMQYHPDKNPGDKKAEEKFKEVTEAYEVLGDPQKKLQYDQFGSVGEGFNFNRGGFKGGPQGGPDFQDAFGDLFGDLFGQTQGRRSRNRKGADLRYSMRLTLEEAAKGVERIIHFMRERNGKSIEAKLSVKVPAGVKHEQKLRLSGEGDDLGPNTQPGDLYVYLEVLDHPLFKLEQDDILLDLPISFLQALKGDEIEVITLTSKVMIKVPAGSSSGTILRLKNKGFPRGGGQFGDMRIRLLIDIPEHLSREEQLALEQLAKSLGDTPKVKDFKEKMQQVLNSRN